MGSRLRVSDEIYAGSHGGSCSGLFFFGSMQQPSVEVLGLGVRGVVGFTS